jgi:hypothetical protein
MLEKGSPRTKETIKPLSALLSQLLVAYTIELDNEFELRMAEGGFPGARLSLTVWTNIVQFIAGEGITVRDLIAPSTVTFDQLKLALGCLERWGFVTLQQEKSVNPKEARRDGWGSGRGIVLTMNIHLTRKGKEAARIWPPLWKEIEERWKLRFGRNEILDLCKSLEEISEQKEVELPMGLPLGFGMDDVVTTPRRKAEKRVDLPLSALLSQVLMMFTLEFNQRSRTPLVLSANIIRVLSGEESVRLGDLPRLTGGSSETSDIGWRVKPYVVLENDNSSKRGKIVRLSPAGVLAQKKYYQLTEGIEKDWEKKFGVAKVRELRSCLEKLLELKKENRPVISLGLVPPKGVARAGEEVPALGRRDVGVAAKQRGRDLVDQTKRFVEDPAGSLPHYPMWDLNRGFGP